MTALLLWLYYPVIPKSGFGWILMFVIGIPTLLLIEWIGERVLSARFFSRLGSTARVMLAVPALVFILAVGTLLIRGGQLIIGH